MLYLPTEMALYVHLLNLEAHLKSSSHRTFRKTYAHSIRRHQTERQNVARPSYDFQRLTRSCLECLAVDDDFGHPCLRWNMEGDPLGFMSEPRHKRYFKARAVLH